MPNLKAKYIIDENGDRVAPITYIDAVRNSSGDSLSDLMVPEKLGSGIGTCSTSSGTALTVSLTDYDLVQNGFVAVTFENDVPANATLNVNGKGAKSIMYKGSAITADTIKADDTVMFCYDGTNYVVTSLGGGGGSSVFPEFVTIQLTQSGGSDSALIGATVVVTNDDTSAVILSTTWQGSGIPVQIDGGVDYTVTVGSITDYIISPNTQSHTAEGGLTRMITFIYHGDLVDLGLPSGTLWARGNIVRNGGTYQIGSETAYGAYVSWGNIVPHFSYNGSSFDDGYNFNSTTYNATQGASITGPITTEATFAPNSGYDAARELLGGSWRLPTSDEFVELNNNCTSAWTTKDGINGREFTSNINGAKIFFPAAGMSQENSFVSFGTECVYWSSSLGSSVEGYDLRANSSSVIANAKYGYRYSGCTVRAVI